MAAPALSRVDHLHVFVSDRAAALRWYADVLGLQPVAALAVWAEGGGPLTLANADDSIRLALFEAPPIARNRSTIAFGVDATSLMAWREHLADALGRRPDLVDHGLAFSLYFSDPEGNPFEITTYEHERVRAAAA